jgi:flavorubredoxin
VKIIEEHMSNGKIQLAAEGILAKWQPKPDNLAKCKALGEKVAQAVNA